MPLQEFHILCRLLQANEHVCDEQRGHLYLGGLVWQMPQSEERSGSDIDLRAQRVFSFMLLSLVETKSTTVATLATLLLVL
jgi:hypothetical protein